MNKLKLVYYDLYEKGTEFLDRYFDENCVELCEVVGTSGAEGILLTDLPAYEGWDLLIIPDMEDRSPVVKLLNLLGIDPGRVIFFSDSTLFCENTDLIYPILTEDYRDQLESVNLDRMYGKRIMGEYATVSAEGCSYLHVASDRLIMGTMFYSGKNWAGDEMRKFDRLARQYYTFSEEQRIFCDIGANIGTTGIYFKKKIDPSINILAFEPSPVNYRMLRINMILNEIADEEYRLENCGVSDHTGEMSFLFDGFNTGGSRIVSGEETKDKVAVISFDEYAEREKLEISRIKYVWVDVEGFEFYFVKGAAHTLSHIDVPMIMEFSPERYRENGGYREFIDLLKKIYKHYIIIQDETDTVHEIDELYSYEGSKEMFDLFLMKR